jgi:hypothetical protein
VSAGGVSARGCERAARGGADSGGGVSAQRVGAHSKRAAGVQRARSGRAAGAQWARSGRVVGVQPVCSRRAVGAQWACSGRVERRAAVWTGTTSQS